MRVDRASSQQLAALQSSTFWSICARAAGLRAGPQLSLSSVFARTAKLTRLSNRKGYQLQRGMSVEFQDRLTVDRNTRSWKAYSDGRSFAGVLDGNQREPRHGR